MVRSEYPTSRGVYYQAFSHLDPQQLQADQWLVHQQLQGHELHQALQYLLLGRRGL